MPVYEEKAKVNGQKRYFIRTYVTDELGNKKQITRHNKKWIGKQGKNLALEEERYLVNKTYNENENITLQELAEMYFRSRESTVKVSTMKKTKGHYETYIKPFFNKKKVFSLTTKDILLFHELIENQRKVVKTNKAKREIGEYPLSTATKQSIHITLKSILSFGCKYINLEKNVASIVGNFQKPKGVVKKKLEFLTKEEFNNFIQFENNKIYKDFFTLLFYTGMRRGELLALTSNDVDFENNEISINKAINPKNGKHSTTPKTDKSNRTIKMLNIVKDILSKYNNQNEIFGLDKIKMTTLQNKCDRNCIKANINKSIRIHDFRHSFASLCIESNIPIGIISQYLGHENISTTQDIYVHLYPNSQNKLIDILNKQDQKQDQKK